MPEEEAHPVSESLYDSLKALTLAGMTHHKRYRSGLVEQIAGGAKGSPKEGFFQKKVIGRRQDMSMRSTIVPDPSLNLDEVALPKKAAAEIYKPFVVSRMTRMGYTPLEAQRAIKESTPAFDRALEAESRERPVLLKRDPVLHKYGVQAFRPRLVPGKTIKIHNLVTSGFNADFDGDKMSAFVPVSPKAVKEAQKMFPSNNLFSSSTGDIMYKPSHEAMQGLFKLTEMGKRTGKTFATAADAARAVKDGEIDMTDVVTIKDAAGDVKTAARAKTTTVGRLLVHNALPESVRSDKMLTDPKFKMDKRTISSTLRQVGETAKSEYSQTADSLKDLGNEFSTGMSIGLGDFVAETTDRDLIMKEAERQAGDIRKKYKDKKQRDTKLVDLYGRADKAIQAKAKAKIEASGNKMYEWVRSGARGNWDQFRQMNVAPMLVVDSKGKTVPVPITKSYGEGLDIGGYWTAMHGARMGTIGRVQGTELPGKLFKEIVNTSINQMVGSEDCDTTKGIAFNVEDKNALDRYTAKPISLGTKGGKRKGSMPAGTLVTPRVLTRLKNNKVKEVVVRSPMKCNHADGICQKCAGLNEDGTEHALGTNIGIIAAQALGEPTTQMAMNAFHEGGVAGARGSSAVDRFARITQLMDLPHTLPGAATLAGEAGKVEKIEKDPAGGWGVHVGGKRHFVSARRDLAVKKGQEVRKGDALSSGVKNPRELLPLTNISAVQRYISDELTKTYDNPSPLHRRNTEVVVRALTNLSQVNDPGDNKDLLQGDYVPTSAINSFNTKLGKTQAPVHHTPILKGTNVMPNEMQTDWLARMQATKLKDTLLDGAAKGWRSNIHGTHPVPAMAYGKELGMGTEDAPWLN
jgi:DNA-directed RNA polymerase subunit beta'